MCTGAPSARGGLRGGDRCRNVDKRIDNRESRECSGVGSGARGLHDGAQNQSRGWGLARAGLTRAAVVEASAAMMTLGGSFSLGLGRVEGGFGDLSSGRNWLLQRF